MFRLTSLLALLCLSAFAQEASPATTQNLTGPDAIFAEGQKYFGQQTPESLKAALADFQQAATEWQKLGDEPKRIDALLSIATTHFLLHNTAACRSTLDQAQQVVETAHDQLGQAKVASAYALFYDSQKDENKAIQYAMQSADLFHSLKRPTDESQVLLLLSTLYQKAQDTQNLIATYQRALPVATAANNVQMEAFLNLRLGQFSLLRQGDDAHTQALAHFQRALAYYRNSTDQFNLAMTWWGLGDTYDRLHDYESARDAYQHAADLSAAIKNDSARGRIYRVLGHEELNFKMWPQAAQHLEQAIVLMKDDSPQTRALAEVELGTARQAMIDKAGAMKAYERAAEESRQAGDHGFEATSWLKIAELHNAAYEWEQSIAASHKAVAAAKSERGNEMLPAALMSLGDGYLNEGNHQKSLDVDLEVLPMLHGNDRINVITSIGINYSWLAQYANALKYLDQGFSESAPDSAERAGVLVAQAEVHTDLNQLTTALKETEESRDLYHKRQVANGEAKALNQLGIVYQWMGDRKDSEAVLNQALQLDRANNNPFAECSTLNNLGELERYFGDFRKAEPLYQQALALARQIGDRYREADILTNLGAVHHALGRETESLSCLHQALEIRRQLGDPNNEAKVLSDIGLVLLDNGELQQGLEALTQSLALLEHTEDLPSKFSTLNNLGSAYSRLGVYREAETYFQRAQHIATSVSLDSSLAIVLNNLATLELTQALQSGASEDKKGMLLERAADLFNQALPITQKAGDKLGQTHILNSLAVIESEQGHQQQALERLRKCLTLVSETGEIESRALTEHTLGTVYSRLNDETAAMRHYHAALALWPKVSSLDGEAQTYLVMAKTERKAGRPEKALADVQKAIELSSRLTSRGGGDENRASLFATTSSYYEFEIDLLMQLAKLHPGQGYEIRAFEARENGRARSLLDLLAEAHANIRQGVDPHLLSDEKSVVRSLAAKEALLQKLSPSADNPGRQELEQQITELKSHYDVIEAQIRDRNPQYAALTQPKALSAKDIQRELLDGDTVLLEYSLGNDRSYLWVLTADSITADELPPRSRLAEMARKLSARIRDKDPIDDQAASLSEALLAPAADKLRQRVVIVADGELESQVPFSVLNTPGVSPAEPLLVRHEILVEPSASTVVMLRRNEAGRRQPEKQVAVIADPVFSPNDERLDGATTTPASADANAIGPAFVRTVDPAGLDKGGYLPRLKGSAVEAQTILQMSKPGQDLALLGVNANKTAVLDAALADYQVVHVATHGLANSDQPALSGLVLSLYDEKARPIDGFLTLNDIYNLKLPVRLVVLSACESGLGEVVRGEGIIGLARGFFYAGAESLVVSLWNVNDQSTAELMRHFYEALLTPGGQQPAAALRSAQLSLMRDTQWHQPYYWAAFTVQGDWR